MEKSNKIFFLIAVMALICMVSCTPKNYYKFSDVEYHNRRTDAVKFLYVVDTIQIDNPVVFTLEGRDYVCADTIVKDKKIDDSLFERQDVYPYSDAFYFCMTMDDFNRNKNFQRHANVIGKVVNIKYKNKTLWTRGFDLPRVTFTIGLVNHDYYEHNTRCADYPNKRLKIKGSQNSYIKVLTCY